MGVKHAVTCTLQEGAFLHQRTAEPRGVLWWVTSLHEMVTKDSHIELGFEVYTGKFATGCPSLHDQNITTTKVLPLDYSTMHLPPVVGICATPIEANEPVAVLPIKSPIMAVLLELQRSGMPGESNVRVNWNHGSHAKAIRELALATCKATAPLSVEYVTPATDAGGRLYAKQASAQRLPRELRLLMYGKTHKEVDLTSAHYEMIRAVTNSPSLPPTQILRSKLRVEWGGSPEMDTDVVKEAVKMLPIRVINSGAFSALKYLVDSQLGTPPWIAAFAHDLEAARNVFTEHVRREVRPRVDALAKNRHFFTVEAIEAIFMQLFLVEVRKRTESPSIIWLHDGIWISREVDDQYLLAAEQHVRSALFPHAVNRGSLFVITDLVDACF